MDALLNRGRVWLLTAGATGLATALAVALTACGTDPNATAAPTNPPLSEPSPIDEDDGTVGEFGVVSPADGDTVGVPFDVAVQTDTELGPIDDELHHLHIWFDEGPFEIYESAPVTIDGIDLPVPDGATTMYVQLHTYEHESVADPVAVSLTVTGSTGSDGGDDGGGDDDEDGGYGY